MALGMLCLGLMAGPWALVAFPFVAAGYTIALRNIHRGLPENAGHPKFYYAAATLCFAAITTDPVLMIANMINAVYLVVFEFRLMRQSLCSLRPVFVKARS
jgi:hypothetical protein